MIHKAVLLHETIQCLNPREGMTYLDCTFGAGGHAFALAQKLDDKLTVIAIDTDEESLKIASKNFSDISKADLKTFNINYRNFDKALEEFEMSKIDAALVDLGFSSDQMDESGRGFSFQRNEDLSMSLKTPITEEDLTAKEIVNNWDFENIRDIIRFYGEERYAERIAREIESERKEREILTTGHLVEVIKKATPISYHRQKIHPATKTFQALRIAVNDEIEALKEFLEKIPKFSGTETRISIIAFHSLEDRVVKNVFREWERQGMGVRVNKKPITASEEEIKTNPRSRSAKLRTFEFK